MVHDPSRREQDEVYLLKSELELNFHKVVAVPLPVIVLNSDTVSVHP